MRKLNYILPMSLLTLLATTSCINGDYDLSDIDTNVRLAVNDLVIPIEMDAVKLDDMIDVEDSRIEKISVDGKSVYGVVETGNFESGTINISGITIPKPELPTISDKLSVDAASVLTSIPTDYDNTTFANLQSVLAAAGINDDTRLIKFQIKDAKQTMTFRSEAVDKAITSIGEIGVEAKLTVSLEFANVTTIAKAYHVNDLRIQLPKGLITDNANYDKETGLLKYATHEANEDLRVSVSLDIKGIDTRIARAELKDQVLSFSQDISAEGSIDVFAKDINPNATLGMLRNLTQVDYKCNAAFENDINVTTFTGGVKYTVDSPAISPVDLSDLPEVLKQAGTVIDMQNPQIYIQVTNPIDAEYGVTPKATLTLTPDLTNEYGPFTQTIAFAGGTTTYCLAPQKPDTYFAKDGVDFSSSQFVEFANLGKILACKSAEGGIIPEQVDINVDPTVEQEVTGFALKNYGKVTGTYAFVAPLALTDKSVICYEKTWDDWQDDDLDNLTITSAVVSATVTSDIPLSITSETEATILGRDSQGKTISLKGTAELPANAKDYQLNIKLDNGQAVSRIYGMTLKVRATGGNTPLSDSQTIVIKNVKAKVTGHYEKEL